MNTIVTHSGPFHTDDVFAVAALRLIPEWKDAILVRTRDPKTIEQATVVLDVGCEYDFAKLRFDHHQEGGAGARTNGIPYASFGLVWKHFGKTITGNEMVAKKIDIELVQPVDAHDIGIEIYTLQHEYQISPFSIDSVIRTFRPNWQEEGDYDKAFLKAVTFAEEILRREIKRIEAACFAYDIVENVYNNTEDKRIIILENPYPFDFFTDTHQDIYFVVLPHTKEGNWKVTAVPKKSGTFDYKLLFPSEWRSKRENELPILSNVPDALFCHGSGSSAYAKSKEGALALAKTALEKN